MRRDRRAAFDVVPAGREERRMHEQVRRAFDVLPGASKIVFLAFRASAPRNEVADERRLRSA